MEKRGLHHMDIHRRDLSILFLVLCIGLGLSVAILPSRALADGGGLPSLTPTQVASATATITLIPTSEATITETPVPTTMSLLPPIEENPVTQASPTPLPAQKQTLPSLLCFSAFAIVFFVVVVIVTLWILGRRNPPVGPGAP
jgi:hypothetical protein